MLKKLHGLFKVNNKIYPLYLGEFFFHSVYMAFRVDAKKIRLSDCFRETHTLTVYGVSYSYFGSRTKIRFSAVLPMLEPKAMITQNRNQG